MTLDFTPEEQKIFDERIADMERRRQADWDKLTERGWANGSSEHAAASQRYWGIREKIIDDIFNARREKELVDKIATEVVKRLKELGNQQDT